MRKDLSAQEYCNDVHIKWINELVNKNCSLTLRQIQKSFQTRFNQSISLPTLAKFIDKFKFTIDFGVLNNDYRGQAELLTTG